MDFKGVKLYAKVDLVMLMENETKKSNLPYGMIDTETDFEVTSIKNILKIKSSSNKMKKIFRSDFKFEDMGVGGLGKEI